MKLFDDEFKGATVNQWIPTGLNTQVKVPKAQQNIQTIIDYLDRASTKAANVSQADVVKGTGLSKSQVSRAFNGSNFNQLLTNKSYTKEIGGNGKPTIIYL